MTETFRDQRDATPLYGLQSERIRLLVAPTVGARLVSLLDRQAGREWLWSADPPRPLRRVPDDAPFDDSPLIGIDECLPTVAPCQVDGTPLPDHGEAWNRSWELDHDAFRHQARIVTTIALRTRPVTLRRSITVDGGGLRFDYTLRSRATGTTTCLWAMHPLLAMRPGDRIWIEGAAPEARVDSAIGLADLVADQRVDWTEPVAGADVRGLLAAGRDQALKLYLSVGAGVSFGCRNPDGTQLHGRSGPVEWLPFLGLWISNGGWNGHRHFAFEPTNACHDRLDHAGRGRAVTLDPGEVRTWFVEWRIGP